jgi:hypothetical protein
MAGINYPSTQSPKQIGDFGKKLVNYVLIRKGHEVTNAEYVGADLNSIFKDKRYAISIKTRYFWKGTSESTMYVITDKDLEHLKNYSEKFNFISLFAVVICYAHINKIYVFLLPTKEIDEILHKTVHGYSLNFSDEHIQKLKDNKFIDFSCWENETIGTKIF